jgi:hypothetical protein
MDRGKVSMRGDSRVAIGEVTVRRPVTLTPTRAFALAVEQRAPSPLAVGPFPARVVQGYRADRAQVLGLEADPTGQRRARALDWPQPMVGRVVRVETPVAAAVAGAVPIEHLLTWTYRAQRAHTSMIGGDDLQQLARAERVTEDGRSPDGCAAIAERAALGVERVDGGGYRLNKVHPDAETVHERVERLSGAKRGLIIRHALADTAPPWSAHRSRLVPVINGKGKPKIVRTRHDQPWYCPVVWDVAPESVMAANADYALWHAALVELARTLAEPGLLVAHVVAPPLAVAEPWEDKLG